MLLILEKFLYEKLHCDYLRLSVSLPLGRKQDLKFILLYFPYKKKDTVFCALWSSWVYFQLTLKGYYGNYEKSATCFFKLI